MGRGGDGATAAPGRRGGGARPGAKGFVPTAKGMVPAAYGVQRGGGGGVVAARMQSVFQSDILKYLVAGALAGMVSRTLVSPLEVIATLNMCSASPPLVSSTVTKQLGARAAAAATAAATPARAAASASSSPSTLAQLRTLFAKEGLRGFFKGNGANCLKVAPTKGIQFLVFEFLKRRILAARTAPASVAAAGDGGAGGVAPPPPPPPAPITALERLFAGGTAGMAAASLCYPLEVAKTLLTAHPESYSSVGGTIASVVRTQGPRALFRGLSPTLVAMFPYVGLEFMVYEQLKLAYTARFIDSKNPDEAAGARQQAVVSVAAMLVMGAVAGTIAQTVCHPLDVVRKRLQLQGIGGRPVVYRSMVGASMGIVRGEGIGGLYKGLRPCYWSVLPSAGVSYLVYERAKAMMGLTSAR